MREMTAAQSSSDSPDRTFEHEPLIQEAASAAGFVVIHPQELPVSVQIKMMDHARSLSGLDGSAMHLVVFARQGTNVLCLNTRKIVNTSQVILESLAGVNSNHTYIGDKSEVEIREMVRHLKFN